MKFTCAIVLFGSSSLALDQNNVSNIDDIIRTDLPTGSIARCPQVQWRPLSPYKSILLPAPWWFLPDADEANKDHYDVTHPTLPPNIILPDPLLPTENKTINGLYTNAVKIYKTDVIKQKQPNNQDCDKWVAALNKFHIMCRCVHMWWWQCSEVGWESWERALSRQTYFARYRRVKAMLDAQMRYEGMVRLGKRLIELAAQNGTLLDAQSKTNRTGQKLHEAAMGTQQMLK